MKKNPRFVDTELDDCLEIQNPVPDVRILFEKRVDQLARSNRTNSPRTEKLALDAVKFLAASTNASHEFKERGAFRNFIGYFSGGNNKIRDAATQHLQESQRATIRLLAKLARQQSFLMDSIRVNQLAIHYLQIQNIQLKKYLVEMFGDIDTRFSEVEAEVLKHRYKINMNTLANSLNLWQMNFKGRAEYLRSKPLSFGRVVEIAVPFYQAMQTTLESMARRDPKNMYRWPGAFQTFFGEALRSAGFGHHVGNEGWKDEQISIADYVKSLFTEEQSGQLTSIRDNIPMHYPLPLMRGCTITGICVWEVNWAIKNALGVGSVLKKLMVNHGIDLDWKISWIELGNDFLWQMKISNDSEFLRDGMLGVLQDLIYETQNRHPELLAASDHRVVENSSQWKQNRVLGYDIELVKGQRKLDLVVQFVDDRTENNGLRIGARFRNFNSQRGRIVSYCLRNGLGDVDFEDRDTIRLSENLDPDWYAWSPRRQEEISDRIQTWVRGLDSYLNPSIENTN